MFAPEHKVAAGLSATAAISSTPRARIDVDELDDSQGNAEAIRQRAYAIWLEEGQVDGRDIEHWHEAERQLEAAQQSKTESAPPRKQRASKKPMGGDGLTEP
jgi:hypothetical protein